MSWFQEVQYFAVGGSDVTYLSARAPGALLDVSHVGRILLITDAAGCVGCFHSVCPLSHRLPFFLFMSASPIHSASSPLHPSAFPERPTSHCPPSANPLSVSPSVSAAMSLTPSLLSMAGLSLVRHPSSPYPPPPVALSVLRRHL